MSSTFCCGRCRQTSATKGSTVERYLGVRTRICCRCGSARLRALSVASRNRRWAKNLGHEVQP